MGGVEKKKEAAVHLIDNRCKSLAKGVKGHCCHDNNVWVNANGGQGVGQGLEAWGSGRVQGSLLQFFLDKGATSPFPPLSSWWMLMLARLRRDATIEFDITHQNDRPPQSDADPSAAAPVQTSNVICCPNDGGRRRVLRWHRPSTPRPPPICLTPLHAWPFLWGGSWWPSLGVCSQSSLPMNGMHHSDTLVQQKFFLTWQTDKLGQAVH